MIPKGGNHGELYSVLIRWPLVATLSRDYILLRGSPGVLKGLYPLGLSSLWLTAWHSAKLITINSSALDLETLRDR
jgi:hypothetical protein